MNNDYNSTHWSRAACSWRTIFLTCVISIPLQTMAQTSASGTSTGDSLGLEEIIVTAQRRTQEISQVPISVSAVSPSQLESLGTMDATVLPQIAPSVSFQTGYSLNSSTISIRGVTSIAVEGGIQPSTSVVINGVPTYRQGEFMSDLNDLATLEILRGPQGTLFGKNSTAGVVDITTRKPGDSFGGNIEGGATNDKEYWIRAAIDLPINDDIKTRLTGWFRNQNPLVENQGTGPDLLGEETHGVSATLAANLASDVTLLVNLGTWNSDSSYNQQFTLIPNPGALGQFQCAITDNACGPQNTRIATNTRPFETAQSRYVTAEINWDISPKDTLTAVTGYRSFRTDQLTDVDATPVGATAGVGFAPNQAGYPIASLASIGQQPDNTRYGSMEVRLHHAGDRADVVSGFFYQSANVIATTQSPIFLDAELLGLPAPVPPTTPFFVNNLVNSHLTNDSASAFSDVTYKITQEFSAFAGLRFTHETLAEIYNRNDYFAPGALYNVITNTPPAPLDTVSLNDTDQQNNLSGRAGVQWRPTEDQNYYLSYNRGYKGEAANTGRATTATDVFAKPEIAGAVEIGTKQKFLDKRMSIAFDLYVQKIQNIQQTGLLPGTDLSNLVNAGDLKSRGAEFEMQWQANRELKLSSGFSYTDAYYAGANAIVPCYQGDPTPSCATTGGRSVAGDPALDAAKWRFNVATDYKHELGSIGAVAMNLNYSWQSKTQFSIDQDPNTLRPSYGLLNGSLTFLSNRNWRVEAFGRNLTNRLYYANLQDAFPIATRFGYLNRDFKRYGGLSLKYNF